MAKPLNADITAFIIDSVEDHPADLVAETVAKFGVSRATVSNYLRRLVEEGLLEAQGQTRSKRYALKIIDEVYGTTKLTPSTQDDEVWRASILPRIGDVPDSLRNICSFGFTEMFNNVIDHSDSPSCFWLYRRDASKIALTIRDYGIGIFEKIQKDFNLSDHRQALFELSKGKLTSDPSKHTGEGIFFTSRMFDYFSISSTDIFYSRRLTDDNQWLIDWEPAKERVPGTMIVMEIALTATRTTASVFAQYEQDEAGFSKTHISVSLAKFASDQLISRSQAKRLLARLDGFTDVMLDFQNVSSIGQGFADEVFRVFPAAHQNVQIHHIQASAEVRAMISHVLQPSTAVVPEQGDLF